MMNPSASRRATTGVAYVFPERRPVGPITAFEQLTNRVEPEDTQAHKNIESMLALY
jgi:hypothetical protein